MVGLSSLLLPTAARAQEATDPPALTRALTSMTAGALGAHLEFLSDHVLEGRFPGTRGEAIAARYIRSQFEMAGLLPGATNGAFFQPVRLVGLDPRPSIVLGVAQRTSTLRYLEDFVAWPTGPDSTLTVDGEVVFVGHGVVAPEWEWDDYGRTPMTGRIAMILTNDPGVSDSSVFDGTTFTRYASWRYKLEQAARMGAVGALLIHSSRTSQYPWSVVRNLWSGEQLQSGGSPGTLRFASWLNEPAARRLVSATGIDYHLLVARARRRDFRPINIGVHAVVDIASRLRRFDGINVIARLGPSPGAADSAVVVVAHYDHLGRRPASGDSVFHGAVDNAAGVSAMLVTAAGLASADSALASSVYFVATTAAEPLHHGVAALLGDPPFPMNRAQLALEIHQPNVWGETRDLAIHGSNDSLLIELAETVAAAEGLSLSPGASPEAGLAFRSDLAAFLDAGVPAITVERGRDVPDSGEREPDTYRKEINLQPSDRYRRDFRYDGLLQQLRFLTRLVWRLAVPVGTP